MYNLAVEIKGIQNVRYSILQKNYNPKSSVSVTLQYDKIMNIIVWICCLFLGRSSDSALKSQRVLVFTLYFLNYICVLKEYSTSKAE